jgi:hypothetical protein
VTARILFQQGPKIKRVRTRCDSGLWQHPRVISTLLKYVFCLLHGILVSSAGEYGSAGSVSPLQFNSHCYCDGRATDVPVRTEDKLGFLRIHLEFISVGKKLRRSDEPDTSARCRKDYKDNSYTRIRAERVARNRAFPA